LLSVGCNKLFAKDAPAPAAPETTEKTLEPAPESASTHANEGAHAGAAAHGRYAVPFAWEASPEEPLARARTFMGEVLTSNDAFIKQGSAHFTPMLMEEKPRATVLTCSDSRVHPSAWDPTPENDVYTVRNLGNQLATALGSVQYGVERLHTPVLLIIGHTGCEAVKTVLNKGKDPGPISEELAHMKLPERRHGADAEDWDTLTSAVVANVDGQVAEAVARFSSFIQSGDLTVVGAVYDLEDDFDQGHGRLRLVNVNSNVEASRIDAFQKAIKEATKPKAPPPGLRRTSEERGPALLDSTGRPLPGGPRAVINGVTVVGNGSFDAVNTGTLRTPPGGTSLIPGTSDLKRAPGYRLTPPAAAPAETGHGKEPEPAKHGETPAGHGKKPDPGHH
jgi:carbonic anhydrase